MRRILSRWFCLRPGGNGHADPMPQRSLLPGGHIDCAAMQGWCVLQCNNAKSGQRVQCHRPRLLCDDRQHDTDPMQPRHGGAHRGHGQVRAVRRGQVHECERQQGVPRLHAWPLLPAWCLRAAAVQGGHALQRNGPQERRRVHRGRPRFLRNGRQHGAEAVQCWDRSEPARFRNMCPVRNWDLCQRDWLRHLPLV